LPIEIAGGKQGVFLTWSTIREKISSLQPSKPNMHETLLTNHEMTRVIHIVKAK